MTEPLWKQMQDQRIFITGGTGFFGCWLLETLIAANRRFASRIHATVLTRSAQTFRARSPHLAADPAISLLEGDVRTFPFPGGDFPLVIHAATDSGRARTGSGRDEALTTLATVFDGTRRTLEFASAHGTRKFLMVSSGAVYGPAPAALPRIPENYLGGPDPCRPGSAYGEAKRAAEALCAAYASPGTLECKIARCFAFVGAHLPLDGSFAIGNFIGSALAGQPIAIHGDGTELRSYLYAADLAVWLWTILIEAPSLQPVNVGSERAVSIAGLAAAVTALLAPGLPIHIKGVRAPGSLAIHYVPSVQLAAKTLGLRQTVGLDEAIRRTAEWYGWRGQSQMGAGH